MNLSPISGDSDDTFCQFIRLVVLKLQVEEVIHLHFAAMAKNNAVMFFSGFFCAKTLRVVLKAHIFNIGPTDLGKVSFKSPGIGLKRTGTEFF